jgi:hypothetical protein
MPRRNSGAKVSSFFRSIQTDPICRAIPRKFFGLLNLRILDIVTGSATVDTLRIDDVGGL